MNPLRLEWLAGFAKDHPDKPEHDNMLVRVDKLPGFERRDLPVRSQPSLGAAWETVKARGVSHMLELLAISNARCDS